MTTILPMPLLHIHRCHNTTRSWSRWQRRVRELSYASSDIGSSGHLAGVLFDTMTERKSCTSAQGRGDRNRGSDGGQIPLYWPTMTSIATHLQNRKLRCGIACHSATTWPLIPTIAESGYPGFEMNTWYGLCAPAGTPRPIVDKVHADTVRASKLPDVIERMKTLGADLHTNTPEEFAAFIERDFARVGKAVQAANLRLD
jgi:tripartite-type tricarboxylate transporter receptor subunit TctC